MRKKSVVVLCAYECLPVYECLCMAPYVMLPDFCMASCVMPPDFIWEDELHSHYHFSYTILRKITHDDLLDLHVRSSLCYLRELGFNEIVCIATLDLLYNYVLLLSQKM
jgi:hypothetical protein